MFGYVYMLTRGVISEKFVKQTIIVSSTIVAKFVACFEASNHGIWLQNFAVDGIERLLKIYCDNNLIFFYSNNNRSFTKSKFIDINFPVVKERVQNKIFTEHIGTSFMLVDPLSKKMISKNEVDEFGLISLRLKKDQLEIDMFEITLHLALGVSLEQFLTCKRLVSNNLHNGSNTISKQHPKYYHSILNSYFKKHETIHQSLCINTKQQNEIIEIRNQHLLEITKSLIKLDLKLDNINDTIEIDYWLFIGQLCKAIWSHGELKQFMVAQNNVEAKLRTMAYGICEENWLKMILEEL
ncbi:Copia protein, partial [Mucuna pruriens]